MLACKAHLALRQCLQQRAQDKMHALRMYQLDRHAQASTSPLQALTTLRCIATSSPAAPPPATAAAAECPDALGAVAGGTSTCLKSR